MSKFKVGDKVRYVKYGPIGWESIDWAAEDLVFGQEYIVREAECADDEVEPYVVIEGTLHGYSIHPKHFELVERDGVTVVEFQRKVAENIVALPPFLAKGPPVIEYTPESKQPGYPDNNPKPQTSTLPTDSEARKGYPLFRGCFRYFPAALAGVSRISKLGNDKHNPGEPMHHARGKSMDHGDCVLRHLVDVDELIAAYDRGDVVSIKQILDEADQFAWRALAFSQEIHERFGAPLAPAAKAAK